MLLTVFVRYSSIPHGQIIMTIDLGILMGDLFLTKFVALILCMTRSVYSTLLKPG